MPDTNGQPPVSDLHVEKTVELPSPIQLREEIALPREAAKFVASTRTTIHRIIFGDDPRLLAVVGPCSIHDTKSGLEYAAKLSELSKEVEDQIQVVMRVYFEKPRTTVGWKGLIMDPQLDGTCDIPTGLRVARQFLIDVLKLNLPTATEFLDPITPQYISDLMSWAAIGARTAESQTHRQMASGLSMPLGIKNTTSGEIQPAINAIQAAMQRQTFLGINLDGHSAAVTTTGNPNCHLILRGGNRGPNHGAGSIQKSVEKLRHSSLHPAVMVDCSHANSGKDPQQQPAVLKEVVDTLVEGETSIIGVMLESHLAGGNQPFPCPLDQLRYGVSITDGCIDFPTTRSCLLEVADRLRNHRRKQF